MSQKNLMLVILSGLLLSIPLHSQNSKPSFMLCQNQNVVRSIRIETQGAGQCVAIYSKDGKDEVVGKSNHISTCEGVVGKIRDNLVKADWKCRDVSQRVSNSVQ